MRNYRGLPIAGVGDFISGVSGSSGNYDLTLDDGTVIEEYDEGDGLVISADAPAAGDLCLIGARTGSRSLDVANVDVIPAEIAAYFFRPADQT